MTSPGPPIERRQSVHPLVFPGGRKVHVVHSPEEELTLRQRLAQEKQHIEQLDIYLHGSDEHISAIRDLHHIKAKRQDELRDEHKEVYDEIEDIVEHLLALQSELHHVTTATVEFDKSFSKYGFSDKMRATDAPSGSETPSSASIETGLAQYGGSAERLKFWRRPTLRQYFHKGLLWRSVNSGEISSFELFVDLLYVGIIGILGDTAADDATGESFLRFIIEFTIAFRIWSDLTNTINWFQTEDIFTRLSVQLYLICLLGFTTNIVYAFDGTYTMMISFYLAERIFMGLYYLWVAYLNIPVAGTMVGQAILVFITCAVWIVSIHVEYPTQLGVIFPAVLLDVAGQAMIPAITQYVFRTTVWGGNKGNKTTKLEKYFQFYPAMNIEHRVERYNAFVTLVLGASVLSTIFQAKSMDPPLTSYFGKSVLGLIQAFAINWLYFDIDGANIMVHAIRRSRNTSVSWLFCHIPFIGGLVLSAGAMARLVLAHDSPNSPTDWLDDEYQDKSAADVSDGLRWFYSAGLGIVLLSMAGISLCHEHKVLEGQRSNKPRRLIARAITAIILILLPLATSLDSQSLMGITCSLVVLVLVGDIFGASCRHQKFWSGGFCDEEKRRHKYVCPRKRRKMARLRSGDEEHGLADGLDEAQDHGDEKGHLDPVTVCAL